MRLSKGPFKIKRRSAVKLSGLLAVVLCSSLGFGQEVQVAPAKGGIALSVSAEKPYQLMPGETKLPILSLQCLHKNKKGAHVLIFMPGGEVGDPQPAGGKGGEPFVVKVNGTQRASMWVPYQDTSSYVYFARSDAERMQFIEAVLNAGTISFDFKPFLTGVATTAVFDLSKLREEVNKHPECSAQ